MLATLRFKEKCTGDEPKPRRNMKVVMKKLHMRCHHGKATYTKKVLAEARVDFEAIKLIDGICQSCPVRAACRQIGPRTLATA